MRARVANHYPTHPFRTVSEETFSELPLFGILGSSAYRRAEDRAMPLLRNPCSRLKLLFATAVHEVVLISKVCVPAFAAIEPIPPLPVKEPDKKIVAIPAMDDILAFAPP